MNLSDLIAAYHEWGQQNRELMGNVPGLLPLLDTMGEAANTPGFGFGMALPAQGPFGLPIKERLGALMENPAYFETPLRSRLAMLTGKRVAEVSPSVGRNVNRLKELIGKSKATEASMRGTPLGQSMAESRRVGSIPKPYPDWLQELLKGGKP